MTLSACYLPHLQMRQERMDGIDSAHRNDGVDETLALFKEMLTGR